MLMYFDSRWNLSEKQVEKLYYRWVSTSIQRLSPTGFLNLQSGLKGDQLQLYIQTCIFYRLYNFFIYLSTNLLINQLVYMIDFFSQKKNKNKNKSAILFQFYFSCLFWWSFIQYSLRMFLFKVHSVNFAQYTNHSKHSHTFLPFKCNFARNQTCLCPDTAAIF